jgi:hypothetical protein
MKPPEKHFKDLLGVEIKTREFIGGSAHQRCLSEIKFIILDTNKVFYERGMKHDQDGDEIFWVSFYYK